MSLKQNTNNNNSNLRSKKLVGGKLRQRGGSDGSDDPKIKQIRKNAKVIMANLEQNVSNNEFNSITLSESEDTITLGEPEVEDLLDKIDLTKQDYRAIIKKIVNNSYNIAYGKNAEKKNYPFQDWSLLYSLEDEEKKQYWRFRRILIDSMILYSTCIALLEQKQKPEQGKAVILFNKQTLREVYKGLECMGLYDTNADEIIKFLNQDIRQAMPDRDTITIDIQAFGSNSVTSDYDISILVPENENFNTLPAEIFKYFRKLCSAYKLIGAGSVDKFNPRIHFDTNLYPHPIQFPDSHDIIEKGETIKVNASITAICPTGKSFLNKISHGTWKSYLPVAKHTYRGKIQKIKNIEKNTINLDLINANVQLLKYFMDLEGKKETSGLQINPKCLVTGGAGAGDEVANATLLALVEGQGQGPGPNVTGDTLHSLFAIQYIRLCEACSLIKHKPSTKIKVDGTEKIVSLDCETTLLKKCTYSDIDNKESANIQIYTKLIEELLGEGAESKQSLAHKDYLHLIHQALFYSVETYYSISAIVHVVFILQNKDKAIKVKFNKVGEGGEGGADAANAAAIKKMKMMLAISAIEQFAFILHYLKDYSDDAEAKDKFIKKTAKYVARLCHAHDLIKDEGEANLNKLLGIDGDRKGINKVELLEVGEYQKIIDKHKDGKRNENGSEIEFANDPYASLTPSNITDFIKEMYDKVKTCLATAAPPAEQ